MEGVTLVDTKFGLGVQGQIPWSVVRGSGAKPPEAGAFLGLGRTKEIANLLSFVL